MPDCRSHEAPEKRMRVVGAALEFRMVLHAHIKGPLRQLHSLHQSAVRGCAADDKPFVLQQLPVLIVEFIAVTMPFADEALLVAGDRKSVV